MTSGTPWAHDENWTYKRRSEEVQDIFWTSNVRSVYILCPGGLGYSEKWLFKKINITPHETSRKAENLQLQYS